MLVVSRKQNQTIVFPNLGISVEILRVAGKAVSVGVRAPDDIRILRGELEQVPSDHPLPSALDPVPGGSRDAHELRNQLNKAGLAMHLIQKQLQAGQGEAAERSVAQALASFAQLDLLAATKKSASSRRQGDGKETVSPKRRALLVEDDANERELLAGYLRLSGYEVDAVEDGLAAVEFIKKNKPNVVVMDMHMPRMNGRQTVTAIRNNPEWDDIQLLIVSGTKQEEMPLLSGDRGVSRWFQKPLKPDDLVNHLAATMN